MKQVANRSFPNEPALFSTMKGSFYFHSSDQDRSCGILLKNKPRGRVVDVCGHSENALVALVAVCFYARRQIDRDQGEAGPSILRIFKPHDVLMAL
jgi:hypothetical protein